MSRLCVFGCAALGLCASAPAAFSQSAVQIPEIVIEGTGGDAAAVPVKEKYQLPQTAASVTAEKIEQTTNTVDTEDAVKYMPSLFVRKRNYGDTQPVLATRTWGVGSSARSLVYADDILLSALIHNNNTIGAPRWGLVAPEEIKRIDFLYGPFSAMYPGNSMGGVLLITTRMPDKPEATLRQTEAFQTFDFYNTKNTYRTDQTSATFGNRWNDLSVFVSANYQNSYSQPLAWITTGGTPAGTTGTIPQFNRTGGVANVIGAGGLLHTEMANLKAKAALDITPDIRATYTIGYWSNDGKSNVETYLRDAAGNPTFGGNGGVGGANFASNYYTIAETHLANSLSLKTDTGRNFDWDLSVSRYDILEDIQRNPFTVAAAGAAFTPNGKIARLDGTNWTNADAKGIWRPGGPGGAHEVSFGLHIDRYHLNNPTYATPAWESGPDETASLYTSGRGTTQTAALWAQEVWRFAPQFKFTAGGRWESWRAFDGFNLNTLTNATTGAITSTAAVDQPAITAQAFSPKASLSWEPNSEWQVTASFGIANRFPTVGELYQTATQPGTIVLPNPNLRPERVISEEIAIERKFVDGKLRLSFFHEDVRDALISQSNFIPPNTTVLTTFVTNVEATRSRGVELAWQKDNVLITGLEVFGSVTYVDPRIVSDPTFASTTGTTADGKMIPNVPAWRTTLGGTYRPNDNWSYTVAGRYQSKTYSTLDNTDTNPNVFQAFDPFLVIDTRVQYKVNEHGSVSFGIDNLNNAKYHLFHPFPQRTYVVQGRMTF
jgi:iron complex outermembrane receptor protein